jgi:hypothetical protein
MDFELSGTKDKKLEVTITLKGTTLVRDCISIINNRAKRKFCLDESITLDWNHQESWA